MNSEGGVGIHGVNEKFTVPSQSHCERAVAASRQCTVPGGDSRFVYDMPWQSIGVAPARLGVGMANISKRRRTRRGFISSFRQDERHAFEIANYLIFMMINGEMEDCKADFTIRSKRRGVESFSLDRLSKHSRSVRNDLSRQTCSALKLRIGRRVGLL